MKKSLLSWQILLLPSLLYLTPVITIGATLVEGLCDGSSDTRISCDQATGLEWLDLTETLGLSYNQSKQTYFVTQLGFRHANESELASLYTAAGVLVLHGGAPENYQGVELLLNLVGCTGQCGTGGAFGEGWIDFDAFDPLKASNPFYQRKPGGGFVVTVNSSMSKDNVYDYMGNFLVRATIIPIPSALWLFSSGLVGLVGISRRK